MCRYCRTLVCDVLSFQAIPLMTLQHALKKIHCDHEREVQTHFELLHCFGVRGQGNQQLMEGGSFSRDADFLLVWK